MSKNGLMAGKRGVIMGVANDHSIAWGVSKALAEQGAQIAFTYQNEALLKRVEPLAQALDAELLIECDVSKDNGIMEAFETVGKTWDSIDFVVHAIAFADKTELRGKYFETTRGNFSMALDISCFSFTETCKAALPLMEKRGGSIITLTYYGAEKVIPHYNVMGVAKAALEASVRYLAADMGEYNIRVNAISAGPVRTLASAGIGDFRYISQWTKANSPLARDTSLEDVGGAGVYLLSNLASGVTGEVHHVDCGYHVVGMKGLNVPDISTVKG
ncbi:enoyl-ACP reductase FabI [Candidatus Paracaedibacter symbiosus]|uniref:enoyl-ACP reductase FabI n=1 Tax=Candidatus Paracaedibacter symbiosus TaxID=244582 RepID=UPI0005097E41|nr:SDR family oxidoreductase [Candidatus Paracaedibacter symbiosus]